MILDARNCGRGQSMASPQWTKMRWESSDPMQMRESRGELEEWCDGGLRLSVKEEDRCISDLKPSGGVSM